MIEHTYVLYHADCYDGTAAAWAVKKALSVEKLPSKRLVMNLEFIAVKYDDPPPALKEGSAVIIVDFCYAVDSMLEIAKKAKELYVMDHHASSEETCRYLKETLPSLCPELFFKIIHDQDRSGALITWQYFHPAQPIPKAIAHVSDRDLWHYAHPQTKNFMAYLSQWQPSRHSRDLIHAFDMADSWNEEVLQKNLDIGEAIRNRESTIIGEIIANSRREEALMVKDKVIRVAVIDCSRSMASEACNMVLEHERKMLTGIKTAIAVFSSQTHRYFQVRSATDAEEHQTALYIASAHGGGGHRHAAGFAVARHIDPSTSTNSDAVGLALLLI